MIHSEKKLLCAEYFIANLLFRSWLLEILKLFVLQIAYLCLSKFLSYESDRYGSLKLIERHLMLIQTISMIDVDTYIQQRVKYIIATFFNG